MQEISPEYQIRVVQDLNEFQKLETAWNGLLESYKRHVPFLCFDWFKIWLRHFLGQDKLFILLVYAGDRLVAIAPFIIKNEKFRGIINAKKIELIGNVHSPIRNFIFDNFSNDGSRVSLMNIFDFLQGQFNDWDLVELDCFPEEDRNTNILSEVIARTGLKQRHYTCFGDWYLDGIDYSGDEYIKRRPKSIRLELKRRKKRLEELGRLEFEVGRDKNKLDHYINLYHEVRSKGWKHPEMDFPFQRDFRRLAADSGWLLHGFLFLNRSPIAAQLRIISNGVAYFMDTVHDPKYNQFGPGSILRAEFTKYLIDVEKVREIDNLKGDEPYKKEWTPKRRERKGIAIFNSTFKGQVLAFLMTRALPIIEKHPLLLPVKSRLLGYLKNRC